MKIFIIYASSGSGHFKAAEAVYNYFKEHNRNIELKLIDVLENSNCWFKNNYNYGYSFLINYTLWLWSLGFSVTSARPLRPIIRWINFFLNRLNTGRITKFLIQENPDFIIATHFLPAEITAYLKRTQKIKSILVNVITDFGVHPFWIYDNTNLYIAASDFTKEELMREGIKGEIIKVLGIPVDAKFLKQYDKDKLCMDFNIKRNKFTILVVTGSFGIGPIEKIVDLLYQDAQLLVVCARNKKLFKRLKDKRYPDLKVFGFVDNLEALMAVSDMIITKPGGLTISEVLAMELPPVFISVIPGQEAKNAGVLKKYGIGLTVENPDELKDIVLDYRTNPDKLNSVRVKMGKIKKPFAAQELCNVICPSSTGDTC